VLKARQLGWPRTPRDFQIYALLLLTLGSVLLMVWLAAGGVAAFIKVLYLLLMLNVGLTIGGDLFYMLIPLLSIQRQIVTGQWDELRLTELGLEEMQNAEHAIAELRCWRLTIPQIVARVLLVGGFVLSVTVPLLASGGGYGVLFVLLVVIVWTAPLLIHFCILEPTWTMQTTARLGVTIAARVAHQTTAVLAGLGAILALRIAEGVVTGLILFIPAFVVTSAMPESLPFLLCGLFTYGFPLFVALPWTMGVFFERVQRIGSKIEVEA